MKPRLRKFALTMHVTCSVGTLGAVTGFLALAIAGLASQDAQTVRAAYIAMALTAWFVIVPLIFAALLTASVAAETTSSGADLLGLRHSIRTHAAGGLLVLLVTATLSVYKPQGMTRYGWRKRHEQRALP